MNALRRPALAVATLLAAFAVCTAPALRVNASAPPVTDPAPAGQTDQTEQPGQPPADQEVQSWALIPANDDPARGGSRSNLTYVADAGAVIKDAVTLMNLGTNVLTFRVFATDAFNSAEGQFDALPSDQEPVDVGSWVTFPQELITVPAGKQVTMPITIKIPAGATAGDHSGAVLASSPSVGVGGTGQVITLDRRTGTRIYLRVNGPLFPELSVTGLDTTYHQAVNPLGGSANVSFTIVNRGNVRLAGTPQVAISGPFGLAETKVTLPDITELLPGGQVELTVDLDGVAAAFVNSTSVRVVAIGADDIGETKDATASARTFAPPLFLLGVLLVLLFGLLALRAYRRRVNANAPPPDEELLLAPELEHQGT